MKHIKPYKQNNNLIFITKNNKFKLYLDDILISQSGFNIEKPDEWFNEKYVTLFNLKTIKKYQNKGYAKYLLNQIFEYTKNKLNINIITLLIYKNNKPALNLYLNNGFKIFQNFNDNEPSYILIKKL